MFSVDVLHTHSSPTRRRMHKAPFANVNTCMGWCTSSRPKQHQVPRACLIGLNGLPKMVQITYPARRCYAGDASVHIRNQTAAIKPLFRRVACTHIRCTNQANRMYHHFFGLFVGQWVIKHTRWHARRSRWSRAATHKGKHHCQSQIRKKSRKSHRRHPTGNARVCHPLR